jgi:hypothetical protein
MNNHDTDEHHPIELIIHQDLQLFDLKQMVEHEARYKCSAREAIAAHRQWRKQYSQQTDMVELLYGSIEGVMLRRRAEDFARLYWLVRADLRKAMSIYMTRMQKTPSWKNAA